MTITDGGYMEIDNEIFNGKPVDSLSISVWLNLYGNAKIHPVFSVNNANGESRCY